MTTAVGIHRHPTKKLGIKPSDPSRPVLKLADFLTGTVVPAHDASVDHTSGVTPGMYQNDKFGVCGPTEICNDRRLITYRAGAYKAPTQDDCFDLYRRSGNKNFDPATGADDNGVDMKTMLDAAHKGGVGGVKSLGYAEVDITNYEEMKAAVDIFGSLSIAVDLKDAQQATSDQSQPYWDYVANSPEWGGHAILIVKYNTSDLDVWTWAELLKMMKAFTDHQLLEAYINIWPEHDAHPGLYKALDMSAFAAAYAAVTNGKKYPGNVTPPNPTPTPAPTPVPVPATGATFPVSAAVADRIHKAAASAKLTDAAYVELRWEKYFNLPPQ